MRKGHDVEWQQKLFDELKEVHSKLSDQYTEIKAINIRMDEGRKRNIEAQDRIYNKLNRQGEVLAHKAEEQDCVYRYDELADKSKKTNRLVWFISACSVCILLAIVSPEMRVFVRSILTKLIGWL